MGRVLVSSRRRLPVPELTAFELLDELADRGRIERAILAGMVAVPNEPPPTGPPYPPRPELIRFEEDWGGYYDGDRFLSGMQVANDPANVGTFLAQLREALGDPYVRVRWSRSRQTWQCLSGPGYLPTGGVEAPTELGAIVEGLRVLVRQLRTADAVSRSRSSSTVDT